MKTNQYNAYQIFTIFGGIEARYDPEGGFTLQGEDDAKDFFLANMREKTGTDGKMLSLRNCSEHDFLYFCTSEEKAIFITPPFEDISSTESNVFDSIQSNPMLMIDEMIEVLQSLDAPKSTSTGIAKGRTNNVKTAKGTKLQTVFALVEADSLIASHTATGAENPQYPQELQPRDRGRESSQAWVQKTANDLDPESLGRTGRADTGAPIVGDDLVVESGNGRTMAIKLAYARDTAGEYRDWLIEESEYFGFKPEQVEAMKEPVLVRIRTTPIDRAQFAVEANQDDKLSFTATERAKSDAKRIDGNLSQLFSPSDDGDLLAASNQKFIHGFLKSLGDTEAAQYMTKDGKPTQALVQRIKAAVFSKAYNDDRLLEMIADQTKPDLQNMLNALSVSAPRFIEAQAANKASTEDVSSQIVDGMEQAIDKKVISAIIEASNALINAKNKNQKITEFVKQGGLFNELPEGVAELAVFIGSSSGSAKKMSIFFKAMADYIQKQAIDSANNSLFGEPDPVEIKDVIQHAVGVIQREYGEKANIDMFSAPPVESDKPIKNDDQGSMFDSALQAIYGHGNKWNSA